MAVIEIQQLHKVYKIGEERVHALRGVNLTIERNEFVAIMGASGSGKSTLMNILGCLDKPTKGVYLLNDKSTHKMGMSQLAQVRNEEIGFIFQSFELLNRATALKNVVLPMLYSTGRLFSAKKRAKAALQRVGLGDRMHHRPNQLSGGQRQRVAVARALVNDPALLLADEPTGNLDSTTTQEITDLFKQLHDAGQTIVIVTHEEDVAGHAHRIVRLHDGQIVSDHPTDEDPIHQEWLRSMSAGFGHPTAVSSRAEGEAPAQGEPGGSSSPTSSVSIEEHQGGPESAMPDLGKPDLGKPGLGKPVSAEPKPNGTHANGNGKPAPRVVASDPAEASS